MFDGFSLDMIDTGEATFACVTAEAALRCSCCMATRRHMPCGTRSPPGWPSDFTVVATDLRGYGESSKPPTTPDHEPYSKRAMARDQVEVMQPARFRPLLRRRPRPWRPLRLPHGARSSRASAQARRARHHPDRRGISGEPTWQFGLGYWHWFFLAQPYDLPERLIGADPDYYYWRRNGPTPPSYVGTEAFEDFRRAFCNPETIHAMCEDYRAGATIDCRLDEADRGSEPHLLPGTRPLERPGRAGKAGTTCKRSGASGPTMCGAVPWTVDTT